MRKETFKILRLPVALLFVAAVMVGCSETPTGGGGGTTGGSNVEIVDFHATPSSIQLGGTDVQVTGTVTDTLGTVLASRQVILSVQPLDIGYFMPAVDTTAANGTFSVLFVPLDTGSATFTAVTGTATSATFASRITVSDTYQPGHYRFEFTTTQGFSLANGNDVIGVTLKVYKSADTLVADGTVIKLEVGERFRDVNGDGYFTENVDELVTDINANGIWDRIGSVPKTVTVSGGEAEFNYTAGTVAGLIYLRATIGDPEDSIYAEQALVLRPTDEIASIKLTTDRSVIQVKATGGIEFANLTAVCFDAYGNRVQSEVPVDFFIVHGPAGGERLTTADFDSNATSHDTITETTNVIGEATVSLLSGIKSGTVMLRAKKGTILSNATLININAGPPAEMSVGVSPCNIRGWDVVNAKATVVALVSDKYSNPVPDSTEVYFWTDEGVVEAASITIGGLAGVAYHSGDPRDDGLAIIRAETAGRTVVDSTVLIVSGPTAEVNVLSYLTQIFVNNEDFTDIWVDLRDVNDNYVANGTAVDILFDDGSSINGATSDGCVGSLARLRYKPSVLSRDYSYTIPDDGIGRVVTGDVFGGGVIGPYSTIQITLLTGYSSVAKSEVKVDGTISPGSTVPVDVVIKDRAGNPLGGHKLYCYAADGMGTVSPDSTYTNAYGEAAFRYTAPVSIGNDYISVSDADPRGGIIITKKVKIDVTD